MAAQPVTYFVELESDECRRLLAENTLGRVAWDSDDGLTVLPVNYTSDGQQILIHTSLAGAMAELATPTRVAFQVDSVDPDTRVGWSVLARGETGPAESAESVAWAPGQRTLGIRISVARLDGRALSS